MSDLDKTAHLIEEVVKSMCATPGRQFSKDAHSQKLYKVIENTKFPRIIADLFINVTMISTPFSGAHSEDSFKSLKKLVKEDGNIVNNLLHCILNIKDAEQTLNVIDFNSGTSTKKTKVSFKKQRALAKEELEKRKNPEYNVNYYMN